MGDRRHEKGDGRQEKGDGRQEKGDGRHEKGDRRLSKRDGRGFYAVLWSRSREKGATSAPALTCGERKEINKILNNNVK